MVVEDLVLLQVVSKILVDEIMIEGELYIADSSMNREIKENHKTIFFR